VDLLVRGLRRRNWKYCLLLGRFGLDGPKAGLFPHSFWPPEKIFGESPLAYAWNFLKDQCVDVIHSHLENAAGFCMPPGLLNHW